MKKILLLCTYLLILSCFNISTDKNFPTILADTDPEITFNIDNNPKYFVLETNAASVLGMVQKILFYNNKLYITDLYQKSIFVFDTSGKFLNKLEKVGKGNEEYLSVNDFAIYDGTLYILDNHNRRIQKYSLNNFTFLDTYKFPKTINTDLKSIFIEDGNIYLYSIFPSGKKNHLIFSCSFDKPLKVKSSYVNPNFDNTLIKDSWISFSKESFIPNQGRTGALINLSFDNSIYKIENNNLETLCEIDFGKYAFPDDIAYYGFEHIMDYIKKNSFKAIQNCFLIRDNLLIQIKKSRRPSQYLLYNIDSKNKKTFKSFVLEPLDQEISIVGSYPDGFIGIISASDIINRYEHIKDKKKHSIELSIKDKNFLKLVSIDSNPVLVFFNINEE
jgi:hypothetical protein